MTDYTTLANIQKLLTTGTIVTNTGDDAVIDQLIDAVTAYVDSETNRTFVSASATRYFDATDDRTLYLDEFTELTSITNGDGTTIATSNVTQLPANLSPKYAIRLKPSASIGWAPDANGDREGVIAVVAKWGLFAACPADVRTACEAMVINLYQARRGKGSEGSAQITGAGVIITPKDVPAIMTAVIRKYRKIL